tara:strand:- start:8498 stop:9016 length:519 start_codon:yes stop_codon:yes gene_type:complete
MAANIQDFYERAKLDFSRDISLRLLSLMGIPFNDIILARTASLPGRIIEDKIVNYKGTEFHYGGKATYSQADGWPVEFYCDMSCDLRARLDTMSFQTWNSNTGTGATSLGGDTIILQVLDKKFAPQLFLTLHDAQIRNIGDVNYSIADGTGEVVNFQTTFAYSRYSMVSINN